MWTGSFWKTTAERVISAFVTSLLGVFGTAEALDLHSVHWGQILTAAGITAGLTLIKCLGSVNIGPKGSPSLVADPAAAGVTPVDPVDRMELREQLAPSNMRLATPPTTRATGAPKVAGYPGGDVAPPD